MNELKKLSDEEKTDLEKTIKELQLNLKSKNDLVEELTMQIEKMKCCGNCINRGLEKYIAYPCSECRRWHRELDSDRWELAE